MDDTEESNISNRTKRRTQNNGEPGIESPLPSYPTRSSNRDASLGDTNDPLGEAASMILSRIDSEMYERAMVFDTERILRKHVFPKSFVWNKPRVQLLRTLPRDIEDMPGILHAGGDRPFSTRSTNEGPFGFGMFDMGGVRREEDVNASSRVEPILSPSPRTKSSQNDSPISQHRKRPNKRTFYDDSDDYEYPLKCSINFQAAARRSEDPRFIDLAVKLPCPPSLESALLNCQKHNILPRDPWLKHDKEEIKKAKMLIEAERAEISSSMPLYWEKLDKKSHFHSPAFLSDEEDSDESDLEDKRYESCLDAVGITITDKDALFKASKRRYERKRKCTKLAQSCFRKWRISVKVGSVSCRSSLVKDKLDNTKPMHLIAAFPDYIQTGESMSIEEAGKMDEQNNFYLGSYDCRASAPHSSMSYQAMRIVKKDVRAKRIINVGRTRLIWSSFHQAANNKIVFTSDLTGEKLIAQSSKRALNAKVFIKLNGKVLTTTSTRLEKPSTNGQRGKNTLEKIKWKDQDVLGAIRRTLDNREDDVPSTELVSSSQKNNLYCTFNPENYLEALTNQLKMPAPGKKRKPVESSSCSDRNSPILMKFHGANILKHIPPKFSCIALDDGYIRVSCETPGTMEPSSVHDLLNSVAQQGTEVDPPQGETLCSVCWSGDEVYKVLTCSDCGLSVHVDCCADSGEYLPYTNTATPAKSPETENPTPCWQCSICRDAQIIPLDSLQNASSTDNSAEDLSLLPSRKSRRTSRLPTRFTENNTEVDTNAFPRVQQTNGIKKERPSPKCILCPHAGGAMSPLKTEYGNNSRWVHEICRIWCPKTNQNEPISTCTLPSSTQTTTPSNSRHLNPTPVCCLCGMADDSSHSKQQGLIKCAATGCSVMFHPMCAILATKLNNQGADGYPKDRKLVSPMPQEPGVDHAAIQNDIEICQEYTLDLLEVTHNKVKKNRYDGLYVKRGTRIDDSNGNSNEIERESESSIVPVGFCGIHNPKRKRSFYGCTPGAEIMSKFIKIPFQN